MYMYTCNQKEVLFETSYEQVAWCDVHPEEVEGHCTHLKMRRSSLDTTFQGASRGTPTKEPYTCSPL